MLSYQIPCKQIILIYFVILKRRVLVIKIISERVLYVHKYIYLYSRVLLIKNFPLVLKSFQES